jgi:uncharacterized membrane protein YphA (DoxX/SURF4 family)
MDVVLQNLSLYTNTGLRLLLGITFILHGKFKLDWGYVNLAEWLYSQGFPLASLFGYVLPWVEVIGGILVVIGVGTRYLASFFCVLLLVALLKVKLSAGFISSTSTGYEFDLLLLFASFHVAVNTSNSFKNVWGIFFRGGETNHV